MAASPAVGFAVSSWFEVARRGFPFKGTTDEGASTNKGAEKRDLEISRDPRIETQKEEEPPLEKLKVNL